MTFMFTIARFFRDKIPRKSEKGAEYGFFIIDSAGQRFA